MPFASAKTQYQDIQPGTPGTGHITFHLGGGLGPDGRNRFYILWKDGKMLVIQAEASYYPPIDEDNDPEYRPILSKLQTMLDNIEFGRESWAYLMRDEETCGQGRLVYKNQPLGLRGPIWAPMIDEDTIEITKWGGVMHKEGWWNGKEVDLCTPWIDTWADYADDQSRGHRLMQSLGLKHLTFPMLGHIVRRGEVVGLLTEAAIGRGVEFSDRGAVVEAVTMMQRKGIIHRSLNGGNIFITDSGVRFLGMSSLLFIEDDDKLEELAEKWHWAGLRRCFEDLKRKSFNDSPTARKMVCPALVIPRLPSPGRSLSFPEVSKLLVVFSLYLDNWLQYFRWRQRHITSSNDDKAVRPKHRLASSPPLSVTSSRRRGSRKFDLISDKPAASSMGHSSRAQIRLGGSRHPYYRESSRREIRDDVTISSDASDSML